PNWRQSLNAPGQTRPVRAPSSPTATSIRCWRPGTKPVSSLFSPGPCSGTSRYARHTTPGSTSPSWYTPGARMSGTGKRTPAAITSCVHQSSASGLRPGEYGTVLERVYLNHQEQKATFIGTSSVTDAAGHQVLAGTGQPIFHVEHSVGGS